MTSIPIEEAYRFCPSCGAENPNPGAAPFRCANCAFAMFFGPVAAVGGLVINPKNELLFVRRARNPGKGQWGLPGGFVDRGETIEEALSREVAEETGLVVGRSDYLISFPNQYDYAGIVAPVIDLFYLCHVASGQVELAEDELDYYEWSVPTPTHLQNMAFESNRRAIEYWIKTL